MTRGRNRLLHLLVGVLALVCVLGLLRRHRRRTQAHAAPQSPVLQVRPLRTRKRRALSPPPFGDASSAWSRRRMRSQRQSPFFSTLPGEIRQLIYEHLLGRRKLHIYAYPCRQGHQHLHLTHVPCYGFCRASCTSRTILETGFYEADFCWGCTAFKALDLGRHRYVGRRNGVGILMSCQRA